MRRTLTLLALSAATIGFTAPTVDAQGRQTGDEFNWSGSLRDGQRLWVRNIKGTVRIETISGSRLEVTASKSWRDSDPAIADVEIVESSEGITVCALWEADEADCGENGHYEHEDMERNDVQVHFTIRVPRGVRIDAATVAGDVEVDGATAPVEAHTVSGDVTVNANADRVRAKTVSGSVSVSGDIRDLRAGSVSGDIDIEGGEFEHGDFKTVSGSITFRGAFAASGDFSFETLSGSVELFLPAALDASFDIETFSGSISNDFGPEGRRKSRFGPGRELDFTAGNGAADVDIETFSGSVRLRRTG